MEMNIEQWLRRQMKMNFFNHIYADIHQNLGKICQDISDSGRDFFLTDGCIYRKGDISWLRAWW